jgi:hypothetical protein
MPLDVETYRSNAKQCEDRAEQLPPGLRRDLLVAARQWRKLAAIADERENLRGQDNTKQQEAG